MHDPAFEPAWQLYRTAKTPMKAASFLPAFAVPQCPLLALNGKGMVHQRTDTLRTAVIGSVLRGGNLVIPAQLVSPPPTRGEG
jgi:hypothetical protein